MSMYSKVLLLIFSCIFSYSFIEKCYAQDFISPIQIPQESPYISDLSKIEKLYYGKSFEGENVESRLSRLEENQFGKKFPELSYSQRLNRIVCNSAKNRSQDTSNLSANNKPSLKERFKKALIGEPTGFTPELYDCPYLNKIGPSYAQGFYGETGWASHNIYHPYLRSSF